MSEQENNEAQPQRKAGGFISRFLTLPNDSMSKTLVVAVLLCLVCSLIVSVAAVVLKPLQASNIELDKRKNILAVAGIPYTDDTVDEAFAQIQAQAVDLVAGEYTDAVNADTFDQRKAARDPEYSVSVSADQDIASIRSRSRYAVVYQVNDANGELEKLILPVNGYGLWSTLYGFLAINSDLKTAGGLKFYEHKETPGLGGEVDNPRWQAQWDGKQLYDADGEVVVALIKGFVDTNSPNANRQVDGLSGATLTSNGGDQSDPLLVGRRCIRALSGKLT